MKTDIDKLVAAHKECGVKLDPRTVSLLDMMVETDRLKTEIINVSSARIEMLERQLRRSKL